MVVFAVRVSDCVEFRNWLKKTIDRGKNLPVAKNPFEWKFKTFKKNKNVLLVCEARPLLFNFSYMGWLSALGIFLTFGLHWILWPCVIVGMLGYFWTSGFYYNLLWIALKKQSKSVVVKRVKLDDVIREVVL